MPCKPRQMAFSGWHARTAAKMALFENMLPEMTESSGLQPMMLIQARLINKVCRWVEATGVFNFIATLAIRVQTRPLFKKQCGGIR